MSARSSSEPVARTKRSSSEAVAQSRKLKVTQVRSVIHRPKDQKSTVRRLGLHRINDSVIKEDRPEIRGMISKVRHLVSVEEVD
uniref:Large ribosomal subunit protein uL30 n=1 Tax=uncultured actinobacterium Rifle_16ft_4_minimus_38826 TaxID=1665148 RepID=A0A0H4TAH7_9ACTN|nr:50S ribosomal protein L30, large subunit ribosomal protein L30 [uncultured actinobacterium Rifle_16ft_4_minimus_38826]